MASLIKPHFLFSTVVLLCGSWILSSTLLSPVASLKKNVTVADILQGYLPLRASALCFVALNCDSLCSLMQPELIGVFQWKKHRPFPAVKRAAQWKSTQVNTHTKRWERERAGGGRRRGIISPVLSIESFSSGGKSKVIRSSASCWHSKQCMFFFSSPLLTYRNLQVNCDVYDTLVCNSWSYYRLECDE